MAVSIQSPPQVFLQKSAKSLEKKRVEFCGGAKNAKVRKRVGKRIEGKDLTQRAQSSHRGGKRR